MTAFIIVMGFFLVAIVILGGDDIDLDLFN